MESRSVRSASSQSEAAEVADKKRSKRSGKIDQPSLLSPRPPTVRWGYCMVQYRSLVMRALTSGTALTRLWLYQYPAHAESASLFRQLHIHVQPK